MPLARRTFLTALAGSAAAVSCTAGADDREDDVPPVPSAAAGAAARRLIGRAHAAQVEFAPPAGPRDTYRVAGRPGAVRITGSSPAVQLTGLGAYLKQVVRADLSWAGEQLHLPRELPAPAHPLTGRANVPHRFVLNDTSDGYTGAYHDWSYWERELDVLALHGFNEVLVYVGADALYHRVLRGFGYGDTELREWIPLPAHQPWWLLQNMAGPAGGPVSGRLLAARARLGRRIADRVRELGMEPVLPGYYGTVPPGFAARQPGAHVVAQGEWYGYRRPDWLDPRGPHFARVAAAYYRTQREMFGTARLFKMDLLHEGGTPGDVPVGDAARGVEKALRTAHPEATWVILGWRHNPPKELVNAVDRTRMLVVDGISDRFPTVTDREADWNGTPYAFGSIWNFGGHTVLGANTRDWVDLYPRWRTRPGSTLRGTALLPEAADNNPAAFELFAELAWRTADLDLRRWFEEWSVRRYGARDPHAAAAWDVLRRTVYGTTRADGWAEGADGLFGARPSLTARSAASWSPKRLRYDPDEFDKALGHLLAVRAGLRSSSAYRRDLLDVARQSLSHRSRALLPRIRQAYEARDRAAFDRLTGDWLSLMDLLDRLLATDSRHLLGSWVAQARSWGGDEEERDRLARDQLSLVTVWGTRAGADAGLHDYANREWAGLVGGLYRKRWATYFDALRAAIDQGGEPRPVDWFALEDAWIRDPGTPPATRPTGSTYDVAAQVRDRLRTG
ncbi:alpha-N-acetylglucosaminidase [Streptomyces sp. VRA16 Mangrove soil]|uniref:alpha-N-acetylglucosaminidase n=1 Tax=Streptomyces sp. VRA16 Mangrove soil TaxID=2817434 RepID=UPI001A9F408B|nr:alpha-N-acetylglucosaminidase [Streptomyces sp. VRA16 Mangrove soil]MBO1331312.1 alpha-N-acetylglucosaminidase [Streptomyces sp. VRA16 Mangrove soil]